jgi:hypothetical protein
MSINNNFEKLMNEVDEETVIPYDKIEKQDKIVKKEFIVDNELSSENNDIKSDVFFYQQ